MTKKSSLFVRQFVIGLGFLSGLFTAIGIDPQEIVIRAAGGAVRTIYPDLQISYLFLILPTVLLLISLAAAYQKGRVLGLVSVLVAYFSGLIILVSLGISLTLLLVAVIVGYIATDRRIFRMAGLR
jgi:hypothetical protein